jgi:hypothetical protein
MEQTIHSAVLPFNLHSTRPLSLSERIVERRRNQHMSKSSSKDFPCLKRGRAAKDEDCAHLCVGRNSSGSTKLQIQLHRVRKEGTRGREDHWGLRPEIAGAGPLVSITCSRFWPTCVRTSPLPLSSTLDHKSYIWFGWPVLEGRI